MDAIGVNKNSQSRQQAYDPQNADWTTDDDDKLWLKTYSYLNARIDNTSR